MKRLVDGVLIDLTAEEITARQTKDTEWASGADARTAERHRRTRNQLLVDSDWTQINDSPLSNEDKTAWATYRQELRGISDLDAWPNLEDADWPVAP